MKRAFMYAGLIGIIITVMVTAAALWYVRPYLPAVGLLLVGLVSAVMVCGFLLLLAYGWLLLRGMWLNQQVIHRGEVVVLRQGDSILHLSAMQQQATRMTSITEVTPVPAIPPPVYPPPSLADMLPQAPSFASIAHQIAPGRLILGYNAQGAIYGDVSDLLSMGVVGKPGRGKSVALLYYLAMLILAQASIYIFDPHGSLNEVASFLNYSDDLSEIAAIVPVLHQELDERLALWKRTRQIRQPLLVLIDELPVISRYEQKNKPEYSVLGLTERIVLEARKLNCYVIVSGQSLPAEVLPTLTRDNLSSRIVFHSSDAHAKMIGLDEVSRKKFLPLLKRAQPGTAILDVSRRAEPDIVALPYTTIDDLRDALRKSQNAFNELHSGFHGLSELSTDNPYESFHAVVTGKLESGMKDAVKGDESIPAFSNAEREEIIRIANIQLATQGRVVRSKIPAAMTPPRNNAFYPVVKYILDEEGL